MLLNAGLISAHFGVNREATPQFNITVEAVDEGSPPQTGTGVVQVNILDVNDQPPFFLTNYTSSVSENASIGTPVLTISAMDNDVGSNAKSTYRLVKIAQRIILGLLACLSGT